ncbi:MAG TPA: hypothetical protein VH277_14205 [Gemmatimonadaceae bacterium]|jgi:hypothetical protein|nr:hypothetical protein [Gemmatimonadaceae bacterium]
MHLRFMRAAIVLATTVVACQSERPVAPVVPATGANRSTSAVADAAPVSLTIFPSIYVTGGIAGIPSATVAVGSVTNADRTVSISSDNPALLAQLPSSVTIPAGENRAGFGLDVPAVSATTNITVTVAGGGTSTSAVLTLEPPGSPAPPTMIDTIFATPLTVAAGNPSTATIRLTSPAPAGGLVVGLAINLPLSATMPAAITFPAGTSVATVPVATFVGFPNSTTTVELRAMAGATIVHNGLNVVTGAVAEPLSIGTTTLNAPLVGGFATVTGGTSVQASISLTGPAPSGGALVTLVSTDTTVATVPASVLIPAGSSSAGFVVSTKAVTTASSTNVGGGFAGGFNVTTLRVNPPSAVTPPPPAPSAPAIPSLLSPSADARFAPRTNITFDWSDASGAASYTIQITDNDKFTSTLVSQTVTASRFSTSTLPTKTLWWRVRSNAADGTPGSFTSARRFEIK